MASTSSPASSVAGRRPVPNSAAKSSIPPPPSQPPHGLRKMASASSLTASNSGSEHAPSVLSRPSSSSLSLEAPPIAPPMTASQVISLAKRSMRIAQTENESQIGEAAAGGADFAPAQGVTIDWSHRNIEHLPDEVVDIIKNGLERLALSHNRISEIPLRFSEFTSLWYLNVRHNHIKEFPLVLCELKSLEILDLGNNHVETLPNEIVKLSSLKVLSLRDNKMTELPLCLADMVSLQRLKLDGNATLVFPPREVIDDVGSPPRDRSVRDGDVTETEKVVTTRIKKYLKQYALEQAEAADDGSEGTETPRLPTKRNVSGRFPIKVNGANLPSPAVGGRVTPSSSSRSHFRGLSQQNTSSVRRPGFMPLTMGSANERGRSNSETLLQASRVDGRSRRMALASAKAAQLGTLDELQPNNRLSHYRGLSHGSAMQGANGTSKSPNTPSDPYLQRPIYVRRLSVLPERRRESKVYDPVVETAKGILYSVFQIHPVIQMLMSLTSDGASKRSSLEIVFYNTNSHVEELEQEIQNHDPANRDTEDGPASRDDNEAVRRACRTLVGAYSHVCTLLVDNIDAFVERGDARYIRTLLTQLWSSIMELRVTLGTIGDGVESEAASTPPQSMSSSQSMSQPPSHTSSIGSMLMMGSTIRARSRENSVTPTVERPMGGSIGGGSIGGGSIGGGLRPRPMPFHSQSTLRVATDVPGQMQSNMSLTSATPRSGESFASTSSRALSADFAEEDRLFERVFLSLRKSSDIVMRTLPGFNAQMTTLVKRESTKRSPDRAAAQRLEEVIKACHYSISRTDILKKQMSDVKLKDPVVRGGHSAFWTASCAFLHAWIEAGTTIKNVARHNSHLPMPQDARLRLRPVQKAVKETMEVILDSPWHWLVRQALHGEQDKLPHMDTPGGVLSPQQQLPMTPQSAALGPAMQATVPSTPSSAAAFIPFHPAAFERADTFSSFGGLSTSRSGTMTSATTSGTHSTLNSLSSFSSMSDSGSAGFSMSPATTSMGVLMAPALPALGRAATSRGVF